MLPALLARRFRVAATLLLAGSLLLFSVVRADENGQELEAGQQVTEKKHPIPVLEYSFERDWKHASPLDYRSVKASGLPMALRHRIDAIWTGGPYFMPADESASDYPIVAEVQYRLRRSPWSDPERMAQARLLDGTRFQGMVTRQFGSGRSFELSAALQHGESIVASEAQGVLERTSVPVELRTEIGEKSDFIVGVEANAARLTAEGESSQTSEAAARVGVGLALTEGLYGQLTAGGRGSRLDDGRGSATVEAGAILIWEAGPDTQYSLTFNRSTRSSLVADAFVEAETVSLAGDLTLSDVWSAYYGVSQSWAEVGSQAEKEIFGGEVAVSFSPSQLIRFSGGYIYRSGSLNRINDDEAEQIIRLSASLRY